MSAKKKHLLMTNMVFWVIAMLMRPLIEMIPTSSGEMPKIFNLLIPMFFLMMGAATTSMISSAVGDKLDE